jgi:hypothetical protein
MSKRIFWIAAFLAFDVLVFVLVFDQFMSPSNRDDGEVAKASAESSARGAPVPRAADSAAPGDPQRVNASGAAASPADASDTAATSSNDALLIVHVVASGTKQPLDSVRIELTSSDLSRTISTSSVDGSDAAPMLTDASGELRIHVPSGVELDLEATSARDDIGSSDVVVPALTSGEQREVTVELPFGNDLRVCGIVLDGGEKPIVGATASAYLADANASLATAVRGAKPERSLPDAARGRAIAMATTTSDGRFVLSVPSWREAYGCVNAKGFGPALVDLMPGHEAVDTALTVHLKRGASIHAHIVDELGDSIAGVTAIAHVEALHLAIDSENVGSALIAAPDSIWKATTNADGVCTLEDLATGTPLTVQLELDNRIRAESITIGSLTPGETTAEWSILVGCEVTGTFVDEAEAPIVNAPMWLLNAESETTGGDGWRFFGTARGPWRGFSRERLTMRRTTDGSGRFVLRDVAPGSWCVALEPQRAYTAAEQNREYIPEGHRVNVAPGERHHDVVLHARHGLFVSGRVLEPDGEPSSRFSVLTAPSDSIELPIFRNGTELQEGYYALTGSDGTFRIGPLPAGELELTARGSPHPPRPSPVPARVKVKSGEAGVILQFARRPSVKGRVIDAVTHTGVTALIVASPNLMTVHEASADGAFSIEGLFPTRYTLIATTADGRIGLLSSLTIDETHEVAALELPVSRGGTLRIRYSGSNNEVPCTVQQGGVLIAMPRLKTGETISVLVPAGEAHLSCHLPNSDEDFEKRVNVKPRDETEIVVEDR